MATPKDKQTTMQDVTALGNMETGRREQARKKLVDIYAKQDKIVVTISPFYAPYLGSNAMISLQGISVYVPANNQPFRIPRSHAGLLLQTIAQIDARQLKLNQMSKVEQNFEPSIGALRI